MTNPSQSKAINYRIDACVVTTLFALLLICMLSFSRQADAATYTYQALTDFDDLNAGDIPFYRDTNEPRNALAINAGNEDYRNRYAMATTDFDGIADYYDITLSTLGELDGDCVYQVVVDGVVVGTVVNDPVTVDYTVQQHQFNDIYVPAGAVLGVRAVAVSNDQIPEGDGFAFARGRWRTLTLTTDDATDTAVAHVDLVLSAETNVSIAGINQPVEVTLTVDNPAISGFDFAATDGLVSAVLPDEVSYGNSNDCFAVGFRVFCALEDIAQDDSVTARFSVLPQQAGDHAIAVSVIADEREVDAIDNLVTATVTASDDPALGAALAKTGGGSTGFFALFGLLLVCLRRSTSR